jgi:hypothetical protein
MTLGLPRMRVGTREARRGRARRRPAARTRSPAGRSGGTTLRRAWPQAAQMNHATSVCAGRRLQLPESSFHALDLLGHGRTRRRFSLSPFRRIDRGSKFKGSGLGAGVGCVHSRHAPSLPRRRADARGAPSRIARNDTHRGIEVRDAIVVEELAKRHARAWTPCAACRSACARAKSSASCCPNGAGKSTTTGMLGTLVYPPGGRATVAGHDVIAGRIR